MMALKYLCLIMCLALFATDVYGKKVYVAYKLPIDFFQAYQQCRLYGGHLASIESEAENAQVVTAIKAVGDLSKEWFIGATDLGSEGRFIWIGLNKKATYLNFPSGEPNNSGGSEHCVTIGSTTGTKWNDNSCAMKAVGFVCAYIRQ